MLSTEVAAGPLDDLLRAACTPPAGAGRAQVLARAQPCADTIRRAGARSYLGYRAFEGLAQAFARSQVLPGPAPGARRMVGPRGRAVQYRQPDSVAFRETQAALLEWVLPGMANAPKDQLRLAATSYGNALSMLSPRPYGEDPAQDLPPRLRRLRTFAGLEDRRRRFDRALVAHRTGKTYAQLTLANLETLLDHYQARGQQEFVEQTLGKVEALGAQLGKRSSSRRRIERWCKKQRRTRRSRR